MDSIINISSGIPLMEEWRLSAPVNLDIGKGENIAIVGRNGSGKTKLVDIICGKHRLASGSLNYYFEDSSKANIKYMAFRDCYGGDTDGSYYHQQRWNQWDISDEKILMSSGELRKYKLAETLSSCPAVLIIDNPYIGLDTESRAVLSAKLKSIISEGNTQLILIFSRYDEVPDFMDSVVEVSCGTVLPKVPYGRWANTVQLPVLAGADAHTSLDNAENTPEVIRLSKVSIRYGQRTILKDLDWVVHKGERWALMGPNGSGKSTLLSIVCADNPQSYACDVELFGRKRGSGESIWDIKSHIGYVSPELHRSCRRDLLSEKIVAGGVSNYHGMFGNVDDKELESAYHWMEIFGIRQLAGRKFLTLSSGEQRLVLLARAFVKNPDLLILDEPLHGLDNDNRKKVIGIIEDYCSDTGITLVMVTHYPEELPGMIDHTITLQKH